MFGLGEDQKKESWKEGYRSGFIVGQESAWGLQEELARTLLERATFDEQRLMWVIPQESYALAKLQLQRDATTAASVSRRELLR